jgi:hypothetical protein
LPAPGWPPTSRWSTPGTTGCCRRGPLTCVHGCRIQTRAWKRGLPAPLMLRPSGPVEGPRWDGRCWPTCAWPWPGRPVAGPPRRRPCGPVPTRGWPGLVRLPGRSWPAVRRRVGGAGRGGDVLSGIETEQVTKA